MFEIYNKTFKMGRITISMVKEYSPDEFGGKVEIKNTFYKGYALYIVGFTIICFILQWVLGNSFTEFA